MMKMAIILLAACSVGTPEISSVEQGINYCPYPPVRCQATNPIASQVCNDLCNDYEGGTAYCPQITAAEAGNCRTFCDPLYTGDAWWECMTACGSRIYHQCVGGQVP